LFLFLVALPKVANARAFSVAVTYVFAKITFPMLLDDLSNDSIHLSINYSVSNKTKQNK
jgi:hypothetical protein